MKASATDSCTRKRLAAVQASPPLRILAAIAPAIATSRSASSRTRNGELPPSSIDALITCGAHSSSSRRPTAVEPVNDSLRTRGSARTASASGAGSAVQTTLTTPCGTPASSSSRAIASAVRGVSCAGLSTTVQPAASAGPSLRVAMAAGKFQGVISSEIPTGACATSIRLAPPGAIANSPVARTASSENQRRNSAA